ncbi:hypothetical protein D3C77_452800 [compost metagenome]
MVLVIQPLLTPTVMAIEQTTMAAQLRRRVRFAMALQVNGAGAGQLLHGQHRARDQTRIVLHLGADRQIKTIAEQVAVAIVQLQLHLQVRISDSELQQQTIEKGLAQRYRHADPHWPRQFILEHCQGLPGPFHLP